MHTNLKSADASEWTYRELRQQSEVSDLLSEVLVRYTPIWRLRDHLCELMRLIHTNLKSRIICVNLSCRQHCSIWSLVIELGELGFRYTPIWSLGGIVCEFCHERRHQFEVSDLLIEPIVNDTHQSEVSDLLSEVIVRYTPVLKSRIIFVNLSSDLHRSEVSDHLRDLVMTCTPIWSLRCRSVWT